MCLRLIGHFESDINNIELKTETSMSDFGSIYIMINKLININATFRIEEIVTRS